MPVLVTLQLDDVLAKWDAAGRDAGHAMQNANGLDLPIQISSLSKSAAS